MTAELTSEQIVTNLLIKNAIVKPEKEHYVSVPWANLGDYLDSLPEGEMKDVKTGSRYNFISSDIVFK